MASGARVFLQWNHPFLLRELIFNTRSFKRDSLDWVLCYPLPLTIRFIGGIVEVGFLQRDGGRPFMSSHYFCDKLCLSISSPKDKTKKNAYIISNGMGLVRPNIQNNHKQNNCKICHPKKPQRTHTPRDLECCLQFGQKELLIGHNAQ